MVEYFNTLIYYVAMVPDGELNSEDAEDMLRCKHSPNTTRRAFSTLGLPPHPVPDLPQSNCHL